MRPGALQPSLASFLLGGAAGPAAFADGKLVMRKSHRKRPDPRALPIESTGLGWGWGAKGIQLLGAAAESQWEELGWGEGH